MQRISRKMKKSAGASRKVGKQTESKAMVDKLAGSLEDEVTSNGHVENKPTN